VIREIDHLVVGVGGLVHELIRFTGGASTRKDAAGERLTVADTLADRLLRESLLQLCPRSSGYSEEGGAFGSPSAGFHVRWQVDPVDGTRPATLGGAFAVSIGALLLDGDRPLGAAGWVYLPTLSILYRALVGPGFSDCRLNGEPAQADALALADLPSHYLAVGSDWHRLGAGAHPLKLSAPGATAVHLTQLVQPGSDVAATVLTRYRPYDAAGGLVVAASGGCQLYLLEHGSPRSAPLDLLEFLRGGDLTPDKYGPPVLVCRPAVAAALRQAPGS
jgi:fructose-1,6-bisphosphatase/inositol monophosphatase family enzyme